MSVIVSARGFRLPAAAAGGFGSVTFVYFTVSSATGAIAPAPSTRRSAGFASAPVPRISEMYAFFVFGWIARSRTRIDAGLGAEQRGNLLIDAGDVTGAGLRAALVAQLERVDRRGVGIGGKQHAVWREAPGRQSR